MAGGRPDHRQHAERRLATTSRDMSAQLIALLPTQLGNLGCSPPTSASYVTQTLAAAGFAMAVQTGVFFTTFHSLTGTSVASFCGSTSLIAWRPGVIIAVCSGSTTAAIVVAWRAIARRRAGSVRKMWLLPGMLAGFWDWPFSRVVQPGVPLSRYCGSFLFPRVCGPATSPQAAATLGFLQVIVIPDGIVADQASSQKDSKSCAEVHG
jgi:hypothetical protein